MCARGPRTCVSVRANMTTQEVLDQMPRAGRALNHPVRLVQHFPAQLTAPPTHGRTQAPKGLAHTVVHLFLETILRVDGRGSDLPGASGKLPGISPNFPEVPWQLPWNFSHCARMILRQSMSSPKVSQTFQEVPRTSPEVTGPPQRSTPLSENLDAL